MMLATTTMNPPSTAGTAAPPPPASASADRLHQALLDSLNDLAMLVETLRRGITGHESAFCLARTLLHVSDSHRRLADLADLLLLQSNCSTQETPG